MLEATQHQIVSEPNAFMSALIWLYLCLRPADSEIDADLLYAVPDQDMQPLWWCDHMEDRF